MGATTTRRFDARFLAWFWLPVLLYVGVIFTLSAQPYLRAPLDFHNSDKLMHLGEYGGLGLLLARAVRAGMPARESGRAALVAIALGMAIGACDERFQSIVPGRECSLADWFADSTGVTLATLLHRAFARTARA